MVGALTRSTLVDLNMKEALSQDDVEDWLYDGARRWYGTTSISERC